MKGLVHIFFLSSTGKQMTIIKKGYYPENWNSIPLSNHKKHDTL